MGAQDFYTVDEAARSGLRDGGLRVGGTWASMRVVFLFWARFNCTP